MKMKAVIYKEYGSPEVLKLVEIEKPIPKSNEVLVKVHATSVCAAVIFGRKGTHPSSKFFTFALRMVYGIIKPRKQILGYEWSGEVESVGKDVTLFKKGDMVFGSTTGLKAGSYAEYVCIPEKWKQGVVAIKPKNISFEEAAIIPIAGMASWEIIEKANIKKGQRVLISGASGSMGSYGLQYAKFLGAEVTGVCSPSKIEMLKSLGADNIIDYTKEDFTKNGEEYDVIFDAGITIPKKQCKSSLKPGGIYISSSMLTSEKTEKLEYIAKLVDEGKIKPYIDRTYPLEKIVEATQYVEDGNKKGNLVITI